MNEAETALSKAEWCRRALANDEAKLDRLNRSRGSLSSGFSETDDPSDIARLLTAEQE